MNTQHKNAELLQEKNCTCGNQTCNCGGTCTCGDTCPGSGCDCGCDCCN